MARMNPATAMVGGIFAVSTGAIFARLAHSPPLVTAAYRVGLAVLIMAPVCIYLSRNAWQRLTRRHLLTGIAAGAFLALHFATWIASLDYTSVANSVVLVNTNPLWVGLLSPLVTGERVHRLTAVGIALSLFGGALIGYGDAAAGSSALTGDLLALTGGVCAAGYLMLGRNLRRHLPVSAYVLICYGSAAIILWLLVGLFRQPVTGFDADTWGAFIGMALIAQVIGHTSYNWALGWVSPGLVAVSLLGEPVCASIMAYILFDEGLSPLKLAGGGVILAAITLSTLGEKRVRSD
ncbi:MAG: DMT family transporter [Pseudomonadota bacterium]